MSDFNLTLFDACELLNKSKKSISRYIKQGLLHPERVKSQHGTLEYRFNTADIETLKTQELNAEETGQDRTEETGHNKLIKKAKSLKNKGFKGVTEETRQDTSGQTRQDRTQETRQDSDIIMLLKETTGLLKEQLTKKDDQIKDLGGTINQLIERDRETNILLGQLQSKVLMLEQLKEPINDDAEETGQAGQDRQDTEDYIEHEAQDELKPTKTGLMNRFCQQWTKLKNRYSRLN